MKLLLPLSLSLSLSSLLLSSGLTELEKAFLWRQIANGRRMPVGFPLEPSQLGRARRGGTIDTHDPDAVKTFFATTAALNSFMDPKILGALVSKGEAFSDNQEGPKEIKVFDDDTVDWDAGRGNIKKIFDLAIHTQDVLFAGSRERLLIDNIKWDDLMAAFKNSNGNDIVKEYQKTKQFEKFVENDEMLATNLAETITDDLTYHLDVVEGGLDNALITLQLQQMLVWFDHSTMMGDTSFWKEDIQDLIWAVDINGKSTWKPSIDDLELKGDKPLVKLMSTLRNILHQVESIETVRIVEGSDSGPGSGMHVEFIIMRARILQAMIEANTRLLFFKDPSRLTLSYLQLFGQMFGNYHSLPPHTVQICADLVPFLENMKSGTKNLLLMLDLRDPEHFERVYGDEEETQNLNKAMVAGKNALLALDCITLIFESSLQFSDEKLKDRNLFDVKSGVMINAELTVTQQLLDYVLFLRRIIQLHGSIFRMAYKTETNHLVSTEEPGQNANKPALVMISKYFYLGKLYMSSKTQVLTGVEELELGAHIMGLISTMHSIDKDLRAVPGVDRKANLLGKDLWTILLGYEELEPSNMEELEHQVFSYCRKIGLVMGMFAQLIDPYHPDHAAKIADLTAHLYNNLNDVIENQKLVPGIQELVETFSAWRFHLHDVTTSRSAYSHKSEISAEKAIGMLLYGEYPHSSSGWQLPMQKDLDMMEDKDIAEKMKDAFKRGQIYLGRIEEQMDGVFRAASQDVSVAAYGEKMKMKIVGDAQRQTKVLAKHVKVFLMDMNKDFVRRAIIALFSSMVSLGSEIIRGYNLVDSADERVKVREEDWKKLFELVMLCFETVRFLGKYEALLQKEGLFDEPGIDEQGASEDIKLEEQLTFFKTIGQVTAQSTDAEKFFPNDKHVRFREVFKAMHSQHKFEKDFLGHIATHLIVGAIEGAREVFNGDVEVKFHSPTTEALPPVIQIAADGEVATPAQLGPKTRQRTTPATPIAPSTRNKHRKRYEQHQK